MNLTAGSLVRELLIDAGVVSFPRAPGVFMDLVEGGGIRVLGNCVTDDGVLRHGPHPICRRRLGSALAASDPPKVASDLWRLTLAALPVDDIRLSTARGTEHPLPLSETIDTDAKSLGSRGCRRP